MNRIKPDDTVEGLRTINEGLRRHNTLYEYLKKEASILSGRDSAQWVRLLDEAREIAYRMDDIECALDKIESRWN